MTQKEKAMGEAGRNSVSGEQLRQYIERIEHVRAKKKDLAEDEKLIFAELRAGGYTPAIIRAVLKRRAAKPADLQEAEALLDMYLAALGMAPEMPLFRSVGLMGVDPTAREQVIDALKQLVPVSGEIIVKAGGQPVRLWRDKDGAAHIEDWQEPKAPPAAPGTDAGKPAKPKKPVPDTDEDGAEELGFAAARDNQPVISNPFPFGDKRRARWDSGWRRGAGGDGMGPSED